MKNKIYMLRVDKNVVIGFAEYQNNGLGSAILDAKGLSNRECENIIRGRFNSQRHNRELNIGTCATRGSFVFEWLSMENIVKPKQTQIALESGKTEDRCWTIEEKDGFFRPVKFEGKLYTAEEMKLELLRRAGM